MLPKNVDVRIVGDRNRRRDLATRSAIYFIIRSCKCDASNKFELGQMVWTKYWRMRDAGLIDKPVTVKRILRAKYGIWSKYGIDRNDLDSDFDN